MCLDETSQQQSLPWATTWGEGETGLRCPPRPGAAGVPDYEYERKGVSKLFMLFAPLVRAVGRVAAGGSHRSANEVRLGRAVKQLVDDDYADKDRIVLVMDNLNTHRPASLYQAFEPVEARHIAERVEIHYTPKPLATRLDRVAGSWVNRAEIEIGVMVRQCLDRRIADQSVLPREVGAWQQQRNQDAIRVDWRFTTEDARIKLRSLYPSFQN